MLKIHFLNVGHGDCTLIQFPSGHLTVVDINRSSEMDKDSFGELLNESFDSQAALTNKILYDIGVKTYGEILQEAKYSIQLTDPICYIKEIVGSNNIFRFISTHPHMDHLSGLDAVRQQNGFINFWALPNEFKPDLEKLDEAGKQDWALYAGLRDGTIGGITVVKPLEGELRDYWQQDGISVLAPNSEILKNASEPNAMSYVLLLKYGPHKVVLGADANVSIWEYLANKYPETLKGITVLKAAHHGRDSGYHQEAVKLMSPQLTVISVGKKPENDASSKYRQYSKNVLSTRWYGNITVTLNEDGSGRFDTQCQRSLDSASAVR
jgi:beta-lactamase superfamily II metal-dependent hydrolase